MDETTIRLFLANDYPRLVAGLTLMSGSRAAAEDAVQEALARAWERSDRGERIDSPATRHGYALERPDDMDPSRDGVRHRTVRHDGAEPADDRGVRGRLGH